MCLVKDSFIPRFTIFPKIVYKVLEEEDGMLKTPFTYDTIKIGHTYKGKFLDNSFIRSLFSSRITDGYIHTYEYMPIGWNFSKCIRVKCIIPPFTLYFKGNGEIASRKLTYLEIV